GGYFDWTQLDPGKSMSSTVRVVLRALVLVSIAQAPILSKVVGQNNRHLASTASVGSESNPLTQPARLSIREVLLPEALSALQLSAGISIVYSPSNLPTRSVTCACYSVTVGEALDRILTATSLRY